MTRYTPLWLQAGSYPAGTDRRLIAAIWPTAVVSGCAVTVSANMNLNVAAGWCVVPAANSTGSVLCASDAVEVVTLGTAPGAGTNRIDVVVCSVTSTDIGTAAGDTFSFGAVAGTPSASPVAPTVPAGSVAIAQVLVIGGQASIQAGNITDRRLPALSVISNLYRASLARSAAQSMAVGGTTLVCDTATFDPMGMLAGGSCKVPVAGYWYVSFGVSLVPGSASGSMQANLQKNGGLALYGSSAGVGLALNSQSVGSGVIQCAIGDILSCNVYHNSAGALSTGGGVIANFLHVHLLST